MKESFIIPCLIDIGAQDVMAMQEICVWTCKHSIALLSPEVSKLALGTEDRQLSQLMVSNVQERGCEIQGDISIMSEMAGSLSSVIPHKVVMLCCSSQWPSSQPHMLEGIGRRMRCVTLHGHWVAELTRHLRPLT